MVATKSSFQQIASPALGSFGFLATIFLKFVPLELGQHKWRYVWPLQILWHVGVGHSLKRPLWGRG